MQKIFFSVLMSVGMVSGAFAQGAVGDVTMSTDPAKAAAVEQHAQELKALPAPETQAKPAAKHSDAHHAPAHKKQSHTAAKPVATK